QRRRTGQSRRLAALPANFHLYRLPLTLAPLLEPCRQALREPLRRQSKARLDLPVRNRQRIVEVRRIREVAHTELIQPLQRASAPLPANQHVNAKFLRVHAEILA